MDAYSSACCTNRPVRLCIESFPPLLPPPWSCPSSPHALSPIVFVPPSGFIQRTASFLQRGSNSRALPGPCSRFAFRRGTPALSGWASPLQKAVTSPVAFCGAWWTRGGSSQEVRREQDRRLAAGPRFLAWELTLP